MKVSGLNNLGHVKDCIATTHNDTYHKSNSC